MDILGVLAEGGFRSYYGLAAVAVLLILGTLKTRSRLVSRRDWQRFAEIHGLEYQPGREPYLKGVVGQTPMKVNIEYTPGSKHRRQRYYTNFNAGIRLVLPRGFRLERRGVVTTAIKAMSHKGLNINDPELDRAYVLNSEDMPGAYKLIAVPELREVLLHLAAKGYEVEIRHGRVGWSVDYYVDRMDLLESHTQDLDMLGVALRNAMTDLYPDGIKPKAKPTAPAATLPTPKRPPPGA
jgi:hypothetical protein